MVDTRFITLGRKEVMEKVGFTISNVLFLELSVGYIAMCRVFLCHLACFKYCMIHFKYKQNYV